MTPMTVRGVPRGLQRDAWWMAADANTGVGRGQTVTGARPVWLLAILVAAFDYLVLQTTGGLGIVVLIGLLAAAAHWTMRQTVTPRRAGLAWAVLLVSLLPAVEVVQTTSILLGWLGLTTFAAMLAFRDWQQAVARLPFSGLVQTIDDISTARIGAPRRSEMLDWILPVGVGVIFLGLLAAANPLISDFAASVSAPRLPEPARVVIWMIAALVFWPLLRLSGVKPLSKIWTSKAGVHRVGIINRRSILRALVVFNVIFGAQTIMDLGYLWGGVRLPDGMTYATYAHRGAYPLMATALLAGGFALIAQPWLDGRVMRGLLLGWVGQTMLLVMSSILRLDLYVDVYGLTELRFAAFIWMIVVALGLVVLVLQILWSQPAGWMLQRAYIIGLVSVFATSLVNVPAYVADHQLTVGPLDRGYVCRLGEGAAVVVQQRSEHLCDMMMSRPTVMAPHDWRDWGFRNARLRNSLATLTSEATQ